MSEMQVPRSYLIFKDYLEQ